MLTSLRDKLTLNQMKRHIHIIRILILDESNGLNGIFGYFTLYYLTKNNYQDMTNNAGLL